MSASSAREVPVRSSSNASRVPGFEQITVIDPDLVEVRNLDGGDHGRRNGVCVACRESLCNDAPKFPERTMAVAEKPEELRSDDAKAAQGRPARAGLSPAVERMFGALVNSSEEPGVSSASEPEATHAPRPGAA